MMKYNLYIIFFLIIFSSNKHEKINNSFDKKIDSLLMQMSLKEKIGQMTQIGIPAICVQKNYWDYMDTLVIDTKKLNFFTNVKYVGSFVGKGYYPPSKYEYFNIISQIQNYVANNSRHKIPILYATDGVHGANYTKNSTLFPHQIGMAATWNYELIKDVSKVTAYELRASNIPWNLAPTADISWQGRWGRICETYGEDPYLVSMMTKAFIEGGTSNEINEFETALCAKHFIGYGGSQYGNDRKNAFISERFLRQYYLPPFISAINNGVQSIMISSGMINSIPCHTNKNLITNILKKEFKFDGVVISDWGDMQFLKDFHKTAENYKEATYQIINAGIDICMVPYDASFSDYLFELVNEKRIPISRINDAVRRILKLKFKLNLFKVPNTNPNNYPRFQSKTSIDLSYKSVSESVTLLKNKKKLLPINQNKKVFITGVASNSLNYLNGPWSRTWSGQDTIYNDSNKNTILESIRNKIGRENVMFNNGVSFDEVKDYNKIISDSKKSDIIIVCLGEKPSTERPSDIKQLSFPKSQINLVKTLSKAEIPIILLLFEGRTLNITEIEPLVDAIIMCYYPGDNSSDAIIDLIYGDINFSGKLPYTYHKSLTTTMPYIHTITDRSDNYGGYTDYDPLYQFGYGLSYSNFQYDSIYLNKKRISISDSIQVKVKIKNNSKYNGKEVVQLYLQDEYASIDPDFEKLIRFKKVDFKPMETKIISFTIYPKDLSFINYDNTKIIENGFFYLKSGDRKNQIIKEKFKLTDYD